MIELKPFLRWAGGKYSLIEKLIPFVPQSIDGTYWEPFLGAGAMFFAIQPKKAILSDLNPHLMNCYKILKYSPEKLSRYLMKYKFKHSESFYYDTRKKYNNGKLSIENAARFIYLNKASFNGIFRVNKKGEFNVPFGYKEQISIPNKEYIFRASNILKDTILISGGFNYILQDANKNDFIYLDPPYPPINGTSYFTHYTKERFSDNDQLLLSNIAKKLSLIGCKVMISNADKKSIREFYKGWNIKSIKVTRWVTCKKEKHNVEEIIITNY